MRFGIDLKARLETAVNAKSPSQILKTLAQVIYLGMRMEFEIIMDSQINNYLDSKSRLHRTRDYYTKILSGNVKRKHPMGHQKIKEQFIFAEAALGNPGFDITLPEAPPSYFHNAAHRKPRRSIRHKRPIYRLDLR